MSNKLGIKLNYTPTYTPQANGLCERQNSTVKTALKAALIQMGEEHKENWYDFLPWILLMKRVAFQDRIKCSPSMLTYGMNLAIPGDLLTDPGEPYSEPQLQELINKLQRNDNNPAAQTKQPHQELVPEPPDNISHVYTRQHKAQGLEAPYAGPFAVVSRPSRSTVKIKVGLTKTGEVRHEVRHWRDLKVAHMRSDAQEAERPKRGRPSKISKPAESGTTSTNEVNKVSREAIVSPNVNKDSNEGGKPKRSTRNPNPVYVDSIVTGPPPQLAFPHKPQAWSASPEDIRAINEGIGRLGG